MAFEFGPSCIPLSAVGMIFNFAGNHLLHYCHTQLRRKIFYPLHKVNSIQLLPNGDIVTTATRREAKIVLKEGGGGGGTGTFDIVYTGEVQVQFRSKAVVVSHGGKQELHPEFFNWFPCMQM